MENHINPEEKWNKSTRVLALGVTFASILMLLYNVLLFLNFDQEYDIETSALIGFVIFFIIVMALGFLCIRNYSRGLARFSNLFERGGKRALFILRWGFWLTIGGVILQFIVFFGIRPSAQSMTFLWIIIGNILLVVATVISSIGFISLSASKGMPDDARKGAAHMSWVCILLLIGACMLSYAVLDGCGIFIKTLTLLINLTGVYFYYTNWKRLLSFKKEEKEEEPID